MTNAERLWAEATLEHRAQLQAVFFPEGLDFDGETFGTAATCLAFSDLGGNLIEENGLASPTGFEPVFWP